MKKLVKLITLLISVTTLVSCATSIQQDIVLSSDLYLQDSDLATIEENLAKIDAEFIETQLINEKALNDLKGMVDKSLKEVELKNALKARLLAIKGRIFLLEGKRPKALELYKGAEDAYKGDAITVILGSRLGEVGSLEEEGKKVFGTSEKALIKLEKALVCYTEKSYTEAVSLFDETFINLPAFYKEAYNSIRNRAWDFRNMDQVSENDKISALISEPYISVDDMLQITQYASRELLPFTGGQRCSSTELYKRVSKAGVLTSVKEGKTCLPKDTVTRALCARFLWNLYCSKKGISVDIYTQAFKGQSESPVMDIPLSYADFDAILGCVENEFMDLIDGIKFYPEDKISGIEFYEIIEKF